MSSTLVARSLSPRGGTCPRLPISSAIMHRLVGVWSGDNFESRLMLATTCVGYFTFIRARKFTAVGTASPGILLSEVAINSRLVPTVVYDSSKTDPFGRGVEIFLGVSGNEVCPLTALMRYLAVNPPGDGQLFVWENRQPLTRTMFVTRFRRRLQSAGLDISQFSGHSLYIRAATSAAAAGVPDHIIKTYGRWCSEVYHLYICTPRESLLGVAPLIGTITR